MKRNIDVRLSTEATEGLIEALQPDAILVATGAKPIIPHIPGIDGENVMYATDAYYHSENSVKKSLLSAEGL